MTKSPLILRPGIADAPRRPTIRRQCNTALFQTGGDKAGPVRIGGYGQHFAGRCPLGPGAAAILADVQRCLRRQQHVTVESQRADCAAAAGPRKVRQKYIGA